MITIDASLPPQIAPLSWLIGHWQGYGIMADPAGTGSASVDSASTDSKSADQMVLEDLQITAENGQLSCRLQVWEAAGSVPPPTPARQAIGKLVRGDLIRTEDLHFALTAEAAQRLTQEITSTSETTQVTQQHYLAGDSEHRKWTGILSGPRIQLQSGAPESPSAPKKASGQVNTLADSPEHGLVRMYGLVGGELMWTQSAFRLDALARGGTVRDEDLQIDMTGRLARLESGQLFNTK